MYDDRDQSDALVATRTIHLVGELTERTATEVIAKLLFLRDADAASPVILKIDSNGGLAVAGFAIVDAIAEARSLTHTVSEHRATGIASLILAAGAPGARIVGPNASIAFAPFWSPRLSIESVSAEMQRMESELVRLLAQFTGQSRDVVRADVRSARELGAEEALAYGLADAMLL